MKEKPVTLNDIAAKLNITPVTVSKALRNHPDISPKTTKLVKKTAAELGYLPNIIARNLAARKSNTIGVVLPKIEHSFFASIIESIYDIAEENGYEVILTISQEDNEREKRQIQTLLAMKVDGIIISISEKTRDTSIFELVKRRGVPLIFIDRIPDMENINKVAVDDRGGAFKATEHAIKIGYRKIGHFAGYTNINIGRERYLGFKDAMKKHKIKINPQWVIEGDYSEKHGYNSFMKLYKEKNLPDFIFTATYPIALGIYAAAAEVGLKIPDDLDLICFGNAKAIELLSPPLSCVDQSTQLISQHCMSILLENIIKGEEFKPKSVLIETDLIIRGTCVKYNRAK
ncbi:LacI family DNA-binding transcriptional regulator [Melioribacteraceae bacterium 4301-Me]|uniref:LacI family DNA-binding transcriptional regulator n=1 Tax=Pyranulibacter aquaticus TaxID=3163344 RepID=UPI00359BC6FC